MISRISRSGNKNGPCPLIHLCNSINITRKHKKIIHSYSLHNQTLDNVQSTTYLGVELASDLTWRIHINKTYAKGNKQLTFLRHNLQVKNRDIKSSAYIGLVRPLVEYCSTIWDPHFHKYIDNLEKIQRRATRYVFSVYRRKAPVTAMINSLGWESLELRRRKARLTRFFQNPTEPCRHTSSSIHHPSSQTKT